MPRALPNVDIMNCIDQKRCNRAQYVWHSRAGKIACISRLLHPNGTRKRPSSRRVMNQTISIGALCSSSFLSESSTVCADSTQTFVAYANRESA